MNEQCPGNCDYDHGNDVANADVMLSQMDDDDEFRAAKRINEKNELNMP